MGKKLVSWNVNGLRACVSNGCFQEFMDKENPDVIYSDALGSDYCPVGLILK